MVQCDDCWSHFHIGCLNPPLPHVPRKTKHCGWVCSDCMAAAMSSDEDEEDEVSDESDDVPAGRSRAQTRKGAAAAADKSTSKAKNKVRRSRRESKAPQVFSPTVGHSHHFDIPLG